MLSLVASFWHAAMDTSVLNLEIYIFIVWLHLAWFVQIDRERRSWWYDAEQSKVRTHINLILMHNEDYLWGTVLVPFQTLWPLWWVVGISDRPYVMDLGATNGTFLNVSHLHNISFFLLDCRLFFSFTCWNTTISIIQLIVQHYMLLKWIRNSLTKWKFLTLMTWWNSVQGNRIEAQRFYELMEKDTLKFGNSRWAFLPLTVRI